MGQKGRPQTPISERIAALLGRHAGSIQPSPLERKNPFDKELDQDAWRCWEYVIPELIDFYNVGKAEQPQLEMMCLYYQEFQRAKREYEGQLIVQDSFGNWKPHPAISIKNAAWKAFLKISEQFGITPVSRPRVKPRGNTTEPVGDEQMPFSILSFSRDRSQGPPPPGPDGEQVQDAG